MLEYLCACYIQNWAALPMAQRGGGSSLRGLFEVQVIRVDCNKTPHNSITIVPLVAAAKARAHTLGGHHPHAGYTV